MPRIDTTKFYLAALKAHGMSPKGVHWYSSESQEKRFEVLLSLLPSLNEKTLVDAGCGFGDLYHYLQLQHAMPKSYIGIDTLKEMCEHAMINTSAPILHKNILTDTLPRADYYICSGALNILHPYESFVFIRNCFLVANEGFVFNVLYGDKESKTYNYMNKKQIESYAKELRVSHVMIQEGYLENDISVAFLK
ncbi:MAG: class I SAM-dependent methyltransferase [Sulfurimonadaceae bacterium]|jgi:SAM-dependent methyltransferase|nr:class I SAM-dependent methyltransferase [Sulfurimonadaceae bacterium]